jgi:hypothetical protein
MLPLGTVVQNVAGLSINVQTVSEKKPTCLTGGKVDWKFSLSEGAPCNGFIVQKVSVSCKLHKCCGRTEGDPDINYSYYEAWRVSKHKDKPATFGGRDTARLFPAFCSIGEYVQLGEVRFYCNAAVGLPDESTDTSIPTWNKFGDRKSYGPEDAPEACKTTAGDLTSTGMFSVPFWGGFGTNSETPPKTRRVWLNWECCPQGGVCKGNGEDEVTMSVIPKRDGEK